MGRFDHELGSHDRRREIRNAQDWHVKIADIMHEERRRMAEMFRVEIRQLDSRLNRVTELLSTALPSCRRCVFNYCDDDDLGQAVLAYKYSNREIVTSECDDCREKE